MKKRIFVWPLSLLAVFAFWHECLSLGLLRELNVNYMLRGYCYAGSRIVDKNAAGGFGTSKNFPKAIGPGLNVERDKVYLLAKPDEETLFAEKYKGLQLLLINSTNAPVSFAASDSRLYIVQEALDKDGQWKPVEYLPSSWCGNSYHHVFLGANEYWEFAAARYMGTYRTKLRFRLDHDQIKIYSNEFEGSVNEGQFKIQQGHKPTSIMDPYNN